MIWHQQSIQETFQSLQTSSHGLPAGEIQERQRRFGLNALVSQKKHGPVYLFFSQFTDFMIVILLAAAAISGFLGHLKDSLTILVLVVLNAVIGFIQEYRAERAMEALKSMTTPEAQVKREGKISVIAAADLVPGDIVILEAGRIVPADLRLVEAAQLKINESALTGESAPVEKNIESLSEVNLPLGDRKNMAYKGTVVTYGRGVGATVATGMTTEFGKIADMLEKAEKVPTPLQRRLAEFGKRLSIAAMIICALVFLTGLMRGEKMILMFMTAISLAVAAIPEALPAIVTISLAFGAKKMVQKKALVKKLPAVETLGSVTYICTDKTGTLTLNQMQAEAFHYEESTSEEFLKAMALCNDAARDIQNKVVGDPTETALFEAAMKKGIDKQILSKTYPRVAELPFDSERKCMTTFHAQPQNEGLIAFTKGAAEVILERSAEASSLNTEKLMKISDQMAEEGLRVLAFAMRRWPAVPKDMDPQKIETDLTFLGLVGILDPPREDAREAVKICKTAGIIPVMITGDHPHTAAAIAKRLEILEASQEVMNGSDLEKIPFEEFLEQVEKIRVYARVSPDQKLKIVEALQKRGQFVAMTGDGVNDAPALKRADIGVAMGITGTDVAKEASSMILLDDHFATIVRAVQEGRKIYDNIRRFVRYAVTTNSAEVWIIFLAPFFGLPIPFLPIQILWINLLTDGLPGLALAAEPGEKGVMKRSPRHPQESIFAQGLGFHVLWVGILMASLILGIQFWCLNQNIAHWQSIIFTSLCVMQLAHVMAIRSERESLFRQGLFSNKPLLGAVGITFLLQLATLYVPFLNDLFKTEPLTLYELGSALIPGLIIFAAVECEKWKRRISA